MPVEYCACINTGTCLQIAVHRCVSVSILPNDIWTWIRLDQPRGRYIWPSLGAMQATPWTIWLWNVRNFLISHRQLKTNRYREKIISDRKVCVLKCRTIDCKMFNCVLINDCGFRNSLSDLRIIFEEERNHRWLG